MQSAFVGAMGGAVAGGVVGALKPQSLAARMAVGGLVGAGVSGGTQVVINVATGRPWNEGLGQAITVGMTTGAMDAAADFYADQLLARRPGQRPMRSLAEDADVGPWRPGFWERAWRLLADEGGYFRLGPADDDVIAARLRNLDEFTGGPSRLRGDDLRRALARSGGDRGALSRRLETARFLRIRSELEALQGQAYIQKDGTVRPTFDPANAEVPVVLGYRENLGRLSGKIPGISCLDTDDLLSGIFGPWGGTGLARADPRGMEWRVEFLDAIKNTDTINFIIDGMEIYENPGEFTRQALNEHENTSLWEMDQIIELGYTDKLHLWETDPHGIPRELSRQETARWLKKWREIRPPKP